MNEVNLHSLGKVFVTAAFLKSVMIQQQTVLSCLSLFSKFSFVVFIIIIGSIIIITVTVIITIIIMFCLFVCCLILND